jgi:regulatory protein
MVKLVPIKSTERYSMAYGKKQGGIKLWRTKDEDGNFPELKEDEIKRIKERAFNYCIWHLGQSNKTRKQLHDKMRERNCPDEIIESTLDKLEEMKYLSDAQYAKNFVQSKQVYRSIGERKISQDLRQKGIPQHIIESVFEENTEDDERERARELLSKRLRSTRNVERQKRINRLVGYLSRNGYNGGIAFSVVKEAIDAEGEEEMGDFEASDDLADD